MRNICKLRNDDCTKVQNLEKEVSKLNKVVTYLVGKLRS